MTRGGIITYEIPPAKTWEYLFEFEVSLRKKLCSQVCAKETSTRLTDNSSPKLGWLYNNWAFICLEIVYLTVAPK